MRQIIKVHEKNSIETSFSYKKDITSLVNFSIAPEKLSNYFIMARKLRSCANDPDMFCYIYGEYVLKYQQSVTNTVIRLYWPTLVNRFPTNIKCGCPIVCVKGALKIGVIGKKNTKVFKVCSSDNLAITKKSLQQKESQQVEVSQYFFFTVKNDQILKHILKVSLIISSKT